MTTDNKLLITLRDTRLGFPLDSGLFYTAIVFKISSLQFVLAHFVPVSIPASFVYDNVRHIQRLENPKIIILAEPIHVNRAVG